MEIVFVLTVAIQLAIVVYVLVTLSAIKNNTAETTEG